MHRRQKGDDGVRLGSVCSAGLRRSCVPVQEGFTGVVGGRKWSSRATGASVAGYRSFSRGSAYV